VVRGPQLFGVIFRVKCEEVILIARLLIDNQEESPIISASYVPFHQLRRADPVIKLDIINEVVNKTGITKTKAELAVETVFESMKKALGQGERIELRGFGVFNVRPRKTGIGRNPRTGAEVNIPPGKAVRFKPGKELQSID
jgi:DNA-binding protein HU-beta